MNTHDAPERPGSDDDRLAREAAADSFRRQVEILKQGRQPKSLNEFAEQKAAEEGHQEEEKE
jgi:hypothetical protein